MDGDSGAARLVGPTDASRVVDGRLLQHLFAGAAELLARNTRRINNLNVFPVPDGDTGTNMLLTFRAALSAVESAPSADVGSAAHAAARGALLGARGNSGVILSQYLQGLARGLEGHDAVDAMDLSEALQAASDAATAAVLQPVEGTILTVARDVARAARTSAIEGGDLTDVLRTATTEARHSVERTPEQLPILREAGVVDAGGAGLAALLDGMRLALTGEPFPEVDADEGAPAALRVPQESYGYCTEFLVRGAELDLSRLRAILGELGDSLLVVGDTSLARVHLHSFQPGRAIDAALQHGAVEGVKIENMQDQNQRLHASLPLAPAALVVVASGEGFAALFRSLGVSAIVPGGATLNPSAEELVRAIRAAPAEGAVLLPNNPNVFLAARQAQGLVDRPVAIVPSKNLAEGVAAALAFDPSQSPEANQIAMERAMASVRSAEVTIAVRDTRIDGRAVASGSLLGLVDERVQVVGSDFPSVVVQSLARLGAETVEIITLYVGADASPEITELVLERVSQEFPSQQVEKIPGGQPHYPYILACE